MKRIMSMLLTFCLICSIFLGLDIQVNAANMQKEQAPRSIAIVFDNSGSMYVDGNMAWCRATYAIEVFATMLNKQDSLSVYPMHEIKIDDASYDMGHPVVLNGADQSTIIRKMYTPQATGTPIEAIDAAYKGLMGANGEKWLIVLTDGDSFYEGGADLGSRTKKKLDERLGRYCQDMNVLYLGIGANAVMPTYHEFENTRAYVDKAADSQDVISKLTAMCNLIFGRDSLPKNRMAEDNLNFDVSLSKLIVFVQGENVSEVAVTDAAGNPVGTKAGESHTRYAELGSGNYGKEADKSLQGMIVTYTDCEAGTYQLNYSGKPTSIEAYYEPDVDLVFTFTDSKGGAVNPNALYEGDYAVSFGMKDARTGEYTNSDLLGKTKYTGSYSVNGEIFPIQCDETSGSYSIPLKMGDSFNTELTAEYLSGYKIHKDGSDFGWPADGLSVAARPAGMLELAISGGDSVYHLATLENGQRFCAEVYYEGQLLTGDALESTELTWDPELSGALVLKEFQGDHYDLILTHKDENNPTATPIGSFTFPITAIYTPQGSNATSSAPVDFTYEIDDSEVAIEVDLDAAQKYYQISKLNDSKPIRANLTSGGEPLTADQFSRIDVQADCGGIAYEIEALPSESAVLIHLNNTDGIDKGKHTISCDVVAADEIGRTNSAHDEMQVQLGIMAMWMKWLILFLILLILLIIALLILHIHKLPKRINTFKRESTMFFDGDDVSRNAQIHADIDKSKLQVDSKFAGKKIGLQMDVQPGKSSYLKTPQLKRSAEVTGVRKFGTGTIQEATIGTVRYVLNEENHKLERIPKSDRPFLIKHGARVSYSGIIQSNGEMKNFTVTTKLNFKKKNK